MRKRMKAEGYFARQRATKITEPGQWGCARLFPGELIFPACPGRALCPPCFQLLFLIPVLPPVILKMNEKPTLLQLHTDTVWGRVPPVLRGNHTQLQTSQLLGAARCYCFPFPQPRAPSLRGKLCLEPRPQKGLLKLEGGVGFVLLPGKGDAFSWP